MTLDEFKNMMAEVLEVEVSQITLESELLDFETYNSVCALTLMVRLEDDAKIECSPEQLGTLKTIGDVAMLITGPAGFSAA